MRAKEVATALNGRLLGEDKIIRRVASLKDAGPDELSAVLWPQDIALAKKSSAGTLVISLAYAADYADALNATLVVVDDISASFIVLKTRIERLMKIQTSRNVNSSARVHETAIVNNATIGANTVIGPYTVIEDGARIGDDCEIGPSVVIYGNASINNRVNIGAHSVIGSCGFVALGDKYAEAMFCFGNVEIDDGVRLGAHCTVDRGFLGTTRVGKNTLIDNMVHLGHDVVIEENVIMAAQSGLAGFVCLKNNVTIGGQVGIKPFVTVGEGARVSGKSMVHCDIKNYEIWSGNPSVPHALYLRAFGRLKRSFKDKKR